MEGGGAPIHPSIAPISFLLGTWRGEGEGGFPTINSFKYGEEIKFTHSGKPVIAYTQKTWKLASGEPMHAESGYWRPKLDGSIEVIIAQSTGLAEIQKGTYDAEKKIVKLQSELVGNASKEAWKDIRVPDNFIECKLDEWALLEDPFFVKEITRAFELIGNELSYVVQMATTTNNLQPHLKALLKKI